MAGARDRPTHSHVRIALGLLGLAWLAWGFGLLRAAAIHSQFVGLGDDVTDSLRRGAYVGERLLVFDITALVTCFAAGGVLLRIQNPTIWSVFVWVVLMLSVAWHGLCFVLHWGFAG